MRGQEYTVMNYLVWAAFAAAFLVAVYSAYHAVASQGCDLSYSQVRDLLRSAAKVNEGTFSTSGPIALCPGTAFSVDYVKSEAGANTAYICWSQGLRKEGTDTVIVSRAVRLPVSVHVETAVDGSRTVYLCIGRPSCWIAPMSSNCIWR